MLRKDARRKSRLIEEHRKRIGDPTMGGGSRRPIMKGYRQRALACTAAIADGPSRPRDLKPIAPDASSHITPRSLRLVRTRRARRLRSDSDKSRACASKIREERTPIYPIASSLSRVNAILNRFGRREAKLLRSRDLNGLARRRMSTFARRRLSDFDLAKTRKRNLRAARNRFNNFLQEVVDDRLSLIFRKRNSGSQASQRGRRHSFD